MNSSNTLNYTFSKRLSMSRKIIPKHIKSVTFVLTQSRLKNMTVLTNTALLKVSKI